MLRDISGMILGLRLVIVDKAARIIDDNSQFFANWDMDLLAVSLETRLCAPCRAENGGCLEGAEALSAQVGVGVVGVHVDVFVAEEDTLLSGSTGVGLFGVSILRYVLILIVPGSRGCNSLSLSSTYIALSVTTTRAVDRRFGLNTQIY